MKTVTTALIVLSAFALSCAVTAASFWAPTYAPHSRAGLDINVWYGDQQHFGKPGHAQRWINILGHVEPAESLHGVCFRLNGGPLTPLNFREDKKRIARDGDFNAEISVDALRPGPNTVKLVARSRSSVVNSRIVEVYNHVGRQWPLPYHVTWANVHRIQDAVQIVDGHWIRTDQGVRSVERYYDRVLAIGDASWTNVEVSTSITVHRLTGPGEGANDTGVTHAAIALRWPGHDKDGRQPTVKWFPLGATAEFCLGNDLQECRWRILDGNWDTWVTQESRRSLEFESTYHLKHRVETLQDGRSRYRAKLWPAHTPEPEAWDVERFESGDLKSGSALLIAHHSDVTFGDVSAIPLGISEPENR